MRLAENRLKDLFERKYEFRLAKRNDIPNIMRYIDVAWKKGHILSKDRELFEYEFCEEGTDDVHILLAIDKATGEIEGMDGFYYTSSVREKGAFDVWGSMWSVRKDHKNIPMLGVQIANEYTRQVGFRYELGVGVNPVTAAPLQKDYFDVTVGKVNHFYRLNELNEYRLAEVVKYDQKNAERNSGSSADQKTEHHLVRANNIDEVTASFDFEKKIKKIPFKDAWYVNRRFFRHPVYEYEIYLLCTKEGNADALMVMRRCWSEGRCALRIMDYVGDITALAGVSESLWKLMDSNTEYIDFYNYGYDVEDIINAGFTLRTDEDANIIPNYFEPFEKKNVDIWFNSDAKDSFVICKADADQDRPNMKTETK